MYYTVLIIVVNFKKEFRLIISSCNLLLLLDSEITFYHVHTLWTGKGNIIFRMVTGISWSLAVWIQRMRRVSCPKVLHARKAGRMWLSYKPGHKDRQRGELGAQLLWDGFRRFYLVLKASYPLHLLHTVCSCNGKPRFLHRMYFFTWCSQ